MDIRAADVAGFFFERNIINLENMEWIQGNERPKRKADKLIKAIVWSKKSFNVADIIACLRKSKYVHIAELLERTLSEHRDSTGTHLVYY